MPGDSLNCWVRNWSVDFQKPDLGGLSVFHFFDKHKENVWGSMAGLVIGIIATVDYAFKRMLGSPEHTRITIHFLNAVLGDSHRITQVTILNPILGKEFEEDKLAVLDILAEDENGRKINIEMQTSVGAELPQRLAYYVATIYSDQLQAGLDYGELRQAINICVLTKSMFADDPRLHLDFRMRDSSGFVLTDDLQIHLLQLPKLDLTADNVIGATPLERWAYFLLNADQMSRDEIRRIFPDAEFGEAAEVLEMISKSPDEHRVYDMRLKFQRDEATRLAATQREIAAARVEGTLLGRIGVFQELLGIGKPTAEELAGFDESQLRELAEQLQTQLRNRTSETGT